MAGAGIREGRKNVGKRGGFEKRVRDDALRVAGAGISCFVKSMFEASDAESVEGLQFVTEALLYKHHFGRQLPSIQDFRCLG